MGVHYSLELHYREDKIKNTSTDVVYEDLLLSELLSWFKFKFFKWVNSPACQSCTSECTYNRAISSSNPQISRIEIHKYEVFYYHSFIF